MIMRIKFNVLSASANGVFNVGDVADLDEKFASPLVKGGFAELLEEEKPVVVEQTEVVEKKKPATKKKGKKVE